MPSLGLDIGGANLKAADAAGRVLSRPFEVWRQPDKLPDELTSMLRGFPRADRLAVTMTAELCDCFRTKREGVHAVLEAVERAAGGREVDVWTTGQRFLSPDKARSSILQVAAANWMALAVYAGRLCPKGNALLIDIGSTTTDVIPLADGVPVPVGKTDTDRLASGELVYMGVRRTPVCAIVSHVPYRGRQIPVAAEWFATSQDVYLTLGEIPEDARDTSTANGRPATREAARERLARVVCADGERFNNRDARAVAEHVRASQQDQLKRALEAVGGRRAGEVSRIVMAGEGEFVARQLAGCIPARPRLISLADELSPEVSRAACAYALAVLADERAGERP